MNKDKRCKTCKETYEVHISYLFSEWDTMDVPQKEDAINTIEHNACNRFVLMTNLELLEWEYERSLIEAPTLNNLK